MKMPPIPGSLHPGDVIVKLEAAALNHIDIWVRMGATGMKIPMPHILGADGAGVVVDIGSEVTSLRTGDKVCLYSFTGCGECEFCLVGSGLYVYPRAQLGGAVRRNVRPLH